jgi:2-methylcitrate dehydratase PrpD
MAKAPIEVLAEYCSALAIATLPPALVELAKLKILDSLACAYLGADTDASRICGRLVARMPEGSSTTLLQGRSAQAADAAYLNSAAVHAILQDDVDLTIGHPACTVVPATLAVGESAGATGADVLAAIVAGYEAMWRVGGRGAFMIPTITRGFRGNTIVGAFGSAAASARVLKLDARQTASAIGASGSFTAGLLKPLNVGTMERAFQQAANTQCGVMAAFLAADGLDGCSSVLEGYGGLYQSFMGADAFPSDALQNLGTEFHMPETFAKPYPSAGSNTVGLAVLDKLLSVSDLRGEDVAGMTVEVIPRFTGKPGYPAIMNPGPFENLEHALISFPFGLACLAVLREVTLGSLRRALNDPRVAPLAGRLELKGVDTPYPLWCRITVVDTRGRTSVATSDEIDWSLFFLTRAAASAKFLAAASPFLGDASAKGALDLILDLDRQESILPLGKVLKAAPTRPQPCD